jgi:hypothetical protein
MPEKLHILLAKMADLENEINQTLRAQENEIRFHFRGKKVIFDRSIKEAHRKLKINFFRWLATRPQNLITGPIIYSMIFPLILLDICVSFYQLCCFPIYRIPKVQRANYINFDRYQLNYLNFIEKFHCTYCAYGTGLMAYITEVIARTEQYFCPIKHARAMIGTHARYQAFLNYGDAENYEEKLERFRISLEKENS